MTVPLFARQENPVSESAWYKVNRPSVIHEIFEDEYVIVNLKSGAYYALDGVGAEVWDWLDKGHSRAEMIAALGAQYDAAQEQISDGMNAFLTELQQENLILPQDGAPAPQSIATQKTQTAFVPPQLQKYTDMQELLLLDPIHEADDTGWPQRKRD